MTTDLGALIEEARAGVRKYRGYAEEPLFRKLADALEQSLAELRQERERTDLSVVAEAEKEIAKWRAALSRAEETIDRAIECLEENEDRDEVAIAILTKYGENKTYDGS